MKYSKGFLLLVCVGLSAGADGPARIIYDVNFSLEQGDEAYIPENRPIIPRAEDFDRVAKMFLARDVEGLQDATDRGDIYWTKAPTKVRVLEKNGFKEPSMYETRILDGPTKGQAGYCLQGSIFRGTPSNQRKSGTGSRQPGMFPEIEIRQKRMCIQLFDQIVPRLDLTKRRPKTLAERLLTVGDESEQDGDRAGAAKVYRIIQDEFPGSVEAKEAAARSDALSGRK